MDCTVNNTHACSSTTANGTSTDRASGTCAPSILFRGTRCKSSRIRVRFSRRRRLVDDDDDDDDDDALVVIDAHRRASNPPTVPRREENVANVPSILNHHRTADVDDLPVVDALATSDACTRRRRRTDDGDILWSFFVNENG